MLENIKNAAVAAGEEILKIYETDFDVEQKNDGEFESPLTEADVKANNIIIKSLEEFGYPILTEEAEDDLKRLDSEFVWIVDPLDGTKGFVKRNGEFTVNIALVKNNRPVLGVIYVPVKRQLFYADEKAAYLSEDGKETPLKVSQIDKIDEMTLVKSRSHASGKLLDVINNNHFKDILTSGSSVKGCMVGMGKADLYPCLHPINEWDICAMDAIVTAAGGIMTDMDGRMLEYNKKNVLFGSTLTSNNKNHEELLKLFR